MTDFIFIGPYKISTDNHHAVVDSTTQNMVQPVYYSPVHTQQNS